MLKISKILVLFLIVGSILSCDPVKKTSKDCHHRITVRNNSDSLIFWNELVKSDSARSCRHCYGAIKLLPKDEFVSDIRTCYEGEINYHGGFKYVFLDTLFNKEVDCDAVELNAHILSIKTYTVDDFNANDWIVEYP